MPRYLNGAERHYLAHLVNRDVSQFQNSDLMWRRLIAQKLVDPTPSAADRALALVRAMSADRLISCNCGGGPCQGCTASHMQAVIAAAELESRAEEQHKRSAPAALALAEATAPGRAARAYTGENLMVQDTVESRIAFADKVRAYHEKIRALGGTVAPGIAPDETVVTLPKGVDLPPFDLQ